MELEGYRRPTCNKVCGSGHVRVNRHRCPQDRPWMSFVDNTLKYIDLPQRNFLSPEFGIKFQREVPSFWGCSSFLITQCMTGPMPKTQPFRQDSDLWRTRTQTQGHGSHIYGIHRASIASRRKIVGHMLPSLLCVQLYIHPCIRPRYSSNIVQDRQRLMIVFSCVYRVFYQSTI